MTVRAIKFGDYQHLLILQANNPEKLVPGILDHRKITINKMT